MDRQRGEGSAGKMVDQESTIEEVNTVSRGGYQGFGVGGDAQCDVVRSAISSAQRDKHRVWLDRLANITSAAALVQAVEGLRTTRRWKYSTTCTKLGEIIGAVKRVEMYGGHRRLKQLVAADVFADYKRGIHLKSLEEEVAFPLALTPIDAERVLENLATDRHWETCVALALQWATAARPQCMLQLQVKNISLEDNGVRIRFVAGKGVAARGEPYTVHTTLGKWAVPMRRWLRERGSGTYVFDRERWAIIKRAIRCALRNVNPAYGLRSIRRGAAISMAREGTPIQVIMHFTGHRSQETCLRYLDWGWNWGDMANQGRRAARALWGESGSESSSRDD